jgi:hypothetical protein
MLCVFHTKEERDQCYQELLKNSSGMKCFPSGITAPTVDIIKKKFSKTRREKSQPVFLLPLHPFFLAMTTISSLG